MYETEGTWCCHEITSWQVCVIRSVTVIARKLTRADSKFGQQMQHQLQCTCFHYFGIVLVVGQLFLLFWCAALYEYTVPKHISHYDACRCVHTLSSHYCLNMCSAVDKYALVQTTDTKLFFFFPLPTKSQAVRLIVNGATVKQGPCSSVVNYID